MSENIPDFFNEMKNMAGGSSLTLPPKSFGEMGGRVLDYRDAEYLKIAFPLYDKYHNPAEIMLGGFLPVFFDLTFGPLSYLAAKKPTASLDLNTTFLKPVSAADREIVVEAEIVSISKSYILFEGSAMKSDGTLIGKCTSRMAVLGR